MWLIPLPDDFCKDIECEIVGETCYNGACHCGIAPTCEGNKTTPFCDADTNQYRSGIHQSQVYVDISIPVLIYLDTLQFFSLSAPHTCYNGVKNNDEDDYDCGGPCSPCGNYSY